MDILPWIILFLPLLAAGAITLFTLHDRRLSAGLSIGAVVTGFVLSILLVSVNGWGPPHESVAARERAELPEDQRAAACAETKACSRCARMRIDASVRLSAATASMMARCSRHHSRTRRPSK